jgi:hypothetical protein
MQARCPHTLGHSGFLPLYLCSAPPASFIGKIHLRNTRDQLQLVGPKSLGVALLTAGFVGMVFTIQVRRWTWRQEQGKDEGWGGPQAVNRARILLAIGRQRLGYIALQTPALPVSSNSLSSAFCHSLCASSPSWA